MYITIVFLTFVSSLAVGFFGRFFGFYGASLLATSCLILAFVVSVFIFYEVALLGCFSYVKFANWMSSETLNVDWGFMFDSLTAVMCCVVTFISCLAHLYSTEYMSHDPHLPRFMSYLSLFTFFMLILVTADNFIQMFVGCGGIGLCSFLLINFWFTRIQANKAAIKAMLMNRIGDFSLIISIILIFIYYKSVDYASVAALTLFLKSDAINFLNMNLSLVTVISVFLFIGAVGKSAQLGLHENLLNLWKKIPGDLKAIVRSTLFWGFFPVVTSDSISFEDLIGLVHNLTDTTLIDTVTLNGDSSIGSYLIKREALLSNRATLSTKDAIVIAKTLTIFKAGNLEITGLSERTLGCFEPNDIGCSRGVFSSLSGSEQLELHDFLESQLEPDSIDDHMANLVMVKASCLGREQQVRDQLVQNYSGSNAIKIALREHLERVIPNTNLSFTE